MIETLPFILLAIACGGAYLAYDRARSLTHRQTWRETAAAIGLQDVREADLLGFVAQLSGTIRGRRVRFEQVTVDSWATATQVTISGDSGVTLRREDETTASQKSWGYKEPEVGDSAFDAAVFIEGPVEVLHAMLDESTRSLVLDLVECRVGGCSRAIIRSIAIKYGDLVLELANADGRTLRAELPDIMKTLLADQDRLRKPSNIPERIAANARYDRLVGVRLRNLTLLADLYHKNPITHETLRHACGDASDAVRLEAAQALGYEGRVTLQDIASRETIGDALKARAISSLGQYLGEERGVAILRRALRKRELQTARACIAALRAFAGAETIHVLGKVLAVEESQLAAAAAEALGACGARGPQRTDAERALLAALDSADPAVQIAAVHALGAAGSVTAVLALKEIVAAASFGSALQRGARQAVANIQARLAGAAPGQLSIANDSGGALSLADEDARGKVSLAAKLTDGS
jgi:HEAT repeat protein